MTNKEKIEHARRLFERSKKLRPLWFRILWPVLLIFDYVGVMRRLRISSTLLERSNEIIEQAERGIIDEAVQDAYRSIFGSLIIKVNHQTISNAIEVDVERLMKRASQPIADGKSEVLSSLQKALKKAVREERYLDAARLRDRINELKK